MGAVADLEAWCWRKKPRQLSKSSLFSFAREFGNRSEVSRRELEQALEQQLSLPQPSQQASRQIQEHTARELQNALPPQSAASGSEGTGQHQKVPDSAYAAAARHLALAAEKLSARAGQCGFSKAAESVASPGELEDFTSLIKEHLASAGRPEGDGRRQAKNGAADDEAGLRLLAAGGSDTALPEGKNGLLQPADAFPRGSVQLSDQELFSGIENLEQQERFEPGRNQRPGQAQALLDQIEGILADHRRSQRKAARHARPETSPQDLSAAVAQLLEQAIISPSLTDSFFINRDAAAWLLAKKSYLALERLMHRRQLLRRGTHASGSRGLQTVLPDRVQHARRLTPHLAMLQTLQRSLRRRATAPHAQLLDEDDLMEYATRSRVGCSVIVALDVSGAVQFGRRIQGVRKACLAFAYYLRRFHPADKIRFIAYHEKVREVPFADVPKLRAVNGAGKDIGSCLSLCRVLLKKDADRVPVVVLIGDGLPARGDRAGFYRFRENNKECIEGALYAARRLRRDRILFTFYQFMDERHLWRDYADDMARRIAAQAGGSLCRIESPDTMALSLVTSYERVRAAALTSYL